MAFIGVEQLSRNSNIQLNIDYKSLDLRLYYSTPLITMSLVSSLFNDSFFSDFDRMFDEAFALRTGSQPQSVVPQSTGNAAPRVLRPKCVSFTSSLR